MSSENHVGIMMAENLRFLGEGSSAQGKPGAKARPRGVVDGQQVDIPVLRDNRTVGTYAGTMSRERKARCKQKRWRGGKSPRQAEAVTRSEEEVAKHGERVPGKAAIVYPVPVP